MSWFQISCEITPKPQYLMAVDFMRYNGFCLFVWENMTWPKFWKSLTISIFFLNFDNVCKFFTTFDKLGQIWENLTNFNKYAKFGHFLQICKSWQFWLTLKIENFWWFLTTEIIETIGHFDNWKDNPGDLWHLRHWLKFWQLRTWIHDNHFLQYWIFFEKFDNFLNTFNKFDDFWQLWQLQWHSWRLVIFVTLIRTLAPPPPCYQPKQMNFKKSFKRPLTPLFIFGNNFAFFLETHLFCTSKISLPHQWSQC